MGPLKGVLSMMGAADVPKDVVEKGEERMSKYKAIIASMTVAERKDDKLLHDRSRISRIAKGSGTKEKDVTDMMSEFNKMKKLFNSFKNDRNMRKRFAGLAK